MKSFLGSLLLVLGTIVASLAAASNERPWYWEDLDSVALDDPELTLFDDVLPLEVAEAPADASGGEGAPVVFVGRSGEAITGAVVETLRAKGRSRLRVRKRPADDEVIAVNEELVGRILAEPVYEDRAEGAILSAEVVAERKAVAAAVAAALGALESDDPAGEGPVYVSVDAEGSWSGSLEPSDGAASTWTAADLEPLAKDKRLAGLPVMRTIVREDSFVDESIAQRLIDGGLAEVRVAAPSVPFEFSRWPGAIPFGIGVAAMVAGVVLMRGARREQFEAEAESEQSGESVGPATRLGSIIAATRALEERSARLQSPELMAAIDPVLFGDCLDFADRRDSLRVVLGGSGYAQVMSHFSTGERRLSRAWSAAADEYVDEARISLGEAIPPFEEALAVLQELRGQAPEAEAVTVGAETLPASAEDNDEETLV